MTNIWPLAVAKKQLRAVIDRAATGQAQIITVQGAPTAVVLSYAEYQCLTAPALSLLEFFQTCPLCRFDSFFHLQIYLHLPPVSLPQV